MARVIEDRENLSEADAKYLSDRGLLSAEEEQEFGFRPTKDGGVAVGETTDDEDLPDSYEDWSKSQLKKEAKARDLDTSGTKTELIARLAENDEEQA